MQRANDLNCKTLARRAWTRPARSGLHTPEAPWKFQAHALVLIAFAQVE
eukprot:CAMPEP_0184325650 /NCGR_PEP_ID=MMETSP1049-20130417/141487_1 /TAXON_ID=77928 /ORGANISM="Proteomonas sulcata, Strain CCMP704" /LENGTH=48 /DNA_ID= /DNA_START= /DNA_END= /DNA_ORIENTATION=